MWPKNLVHIANMSPVSAPAHIVVGDVSDASTIWAPASIVFLVLLDADAVTRNSKNNFQPSRQWLDFEGSCGTSQHNLHHLSSKYMILIFLSMGTHHVIAQQAA